MYQRSYSDDQLAAAVAESHSWRGVMRSLGLRATSAGSTRSVRRHAERLGLSHAHFTGQRRWNDSALAAAVGSSRTWTQVAVALNLVPEGGTLSALRAHSHRLGLATDHLGRRPAPQESGSLHSLEFRSEFLRDAGSMFAATWFTLRGAHVSWPLEPCRYDLLVDLHDGLQRVQVKTTERAGPTAALTMSNSRRRGRQIYAPGEIDSFFAMDGELNAFLIPYDVIAGYGEILLSHYIAFKIVEQGRLVPATSCASRAP